MEYWDINREVCSFLPNYENKSQSFVITCLKERKPVMFRVCYIPQFSLYFIL